ncbi:response regulator [Opacimonas viscosa]|uniref:histidine kinase n=1 Tax=Opacimonas viscosa TaxID=2961944 RepID=A0AA41WZE1_9ALTE|nr:response regulator [Opacimonas viscosa]MCP3429282.1 response regulator [Opacimonas viscosa]
MIGLTQIKRFTLSLSLLLCLALSSTVSADTLTVSPSSNNFFYFGSIVGGLVILAAYNLLLFLTSRDYSSLTFSLYTISVLTYLAYGTYDFKPTSVFPYSENINNPSLVLFCIVAIAGFLYHLFTEEEKTPLVKQTHMFVNVLCGLCFTALLAFEVNSPLYYVPLIVVVILSLSALAYISCKHTQTVQSPLFFASLAILLPLIAIFLHLLSIGLFGQAPSFTLFGISLLLFVQSLLFTVALNQKERIKLLAEINDITHDLQTNLLFIEEQNASLDIARKTALKSSNAKSRFLANISHEIRTPLNAIVGFSRELQSANLPTEKKEQINLINFAANNLNALVNDVLDFSKIEAGKLNIKTAEYSPLSLFEELSEVTAKSAQLKHLEFIFETNNLPAKLTGDVLRLKQVLNNLLSNALKFTDTGIIKLSVVSRILQRNKVELIIKVSDTGIGISPENIRKLFSAFSQIDDDVNRQFQGSGLGLVISREIIKMMKGHISIESTEGFGSTFTVAIKQQLASKEQIFDVQSTLRGKHALVFDPLHESRSATAKLLHNIGMRTTSVDSFEYLQALSCQTENKFDYAFFACPQAHSLQRLSILNQVEKFKIKKPVVLYSGIKPLEQHPKFTPDIFAELSLPLTPSKVEQLENTQLKNRINPMQIRMKALPPLKILAVDDLPINLRLLETWLKTTNITLVLANSGHEALEKCADEDFDMILMDIQMPNMDGVVTTSHIRKTDRNMGTPVVALTAHGFNEDREHFLKSGFDDFIAKPIDLSALLDLIEMWCQPPETLPDIILPDGLVEGLQEIKSVDWELAIRRANYNSSAAKELLGEFMIMLPKIMRDIKRQFTQSKTKELQANIHKLHGACCYTGVPQLQKLCFTIERDYKNGITQDLSAQVDMLLNEAERVVIEAREVIKTVEDEAFTNAS